MTNKYQFYDIVKIVSTKPSKKKINNCEGIIRGMSQNEETGEWEYAARIASDDDLVWYVMEEELQPTGKKADPENYMSNERVRVQVDPEAGEGRIVNDD